MTDDGNLRIYGPARSVVRGTASIAAPELEHSGLYLKYVGPFFRQAARAVCAVVHHHFIIIYVSSVCPSRFMSKTIQDRAIVTMEYEQETVPKLSNGTIFNDLERP